MAYLYRKHRSPYGYVRYVDSDRIVKHTAEGEDVGAIMGWFATGNAAGV